MSCCSKGAKSAADFIEALDNQIRTDNVKIQEYEFNATYERRLAESALLRGQEEEARMRISLALMYDRRKSVALKVYENRVKLMNSIDEAQIGQSSMHFLLGGSVTLQQILELQPDAQKTLQEQAPLVLPDVPKDEVDHEFQERLKKLKEPTRVAEAL